MVPVDCYPTFSGFISATNCFHAQDPGNLQHFVILSQCAIHNSGSSTLF